MKILVLSDSHAGLSFMRRCIASVKPDAVIHLGDYYDDASAMAEENPGLTFYRLPGNCDRYRCPQFVPEMLEDVVCGVRIFMTHGHKHSVKSGTGALVADARRRGVQAVLYGHTHRAECRQESDGMWVLNPGACGSYGGSAGVMVTQGGEIKACYLINYADLEETQ